MKCQASFSSKMKKGIKRRDEIFKICRCLKKPNKAWDHLPTKNYFYEVPQMAQRCLIIINKIDKLMEPLLFCVLGPKNNGKVGCFKKNMS